MTKLGLPDNVEACLFDLDGVPAKTAVVRAAAWKEAFDDFLRRREGAAFRPCRTPGSGRVEDALAGMDAGPAGGFGAVFGVDRVGQADALRRHGADIVVSDLSELLEGRT